jgi:hypothetical protein
MKNRIFALSVMAVTLAFSQLHVSALQKKEKTVPDREGHHAAMMACAKACSDCQRECDMCATHCTHLISEGKKEHLASQRTCLDCANICATAAQITSRHGPFASLICEPCAEACNRCAKECEKHPDDQHMKRCAEECRRCEKACRTMVKHMRIAERE